MLGWWGETAERAVWSFATMRSGGLCVTEPGIAQMLVWSAGSCKWHLQVVQGYNHYKLSYWYPTCMHGYNDYSKTLTLTFSGAEALTQATFGEGLGRIWLDNVRCTGSERILLNCTASFTGINPCTHAQDAGVRCPIGKTNTKNVLV